MGNREDLLSGARQAILDHGLAKVTARDIAKAAGVSLAAIGYHFGSKDQLVTEALTEGVGAAIGDEMDAVIKRAGQGASAGESVAGTWDGFLDILRGNQQSLLLSLENGLRIARNPESQSFMNEATGRALGEMAELLRETHPELSADQAAAVAKLYFLLFQGMSLQSLIAPGGDLFDGDDLVTAIGALRGS